MLLWTIQKKTILLLFFLNTEITKNFDNSKLRYVSNRDFQTRCLTKNLI